MTSTIPTFRRTSGIIIPTSFAEFDFYQRIEEHLTRIQKDYHSETLIANKFFIKTKDSLIIPRHFPIHKYVPCLIQDEHPEGKDIIINHNIEPRDAIQKQFMDLMVSKQSGIIQLNPGIGKTVIAIYSIAVRAKKTFILVHRTSLVDQWIDRFGDFTDITPDRIGIVSSSNFEEIFQKDIIVATTQTFISSLNIKQGMFIQSLRQADIGVFIGDEVHTTVGAPTFSQCSILMPTKINFGLSATPYRYDGNGDIIEYHLGDIYESDDAGSTVGAKVTIILLDFGVDVPYRHKYLHWEGKFQKARYLSIIKNSKRFMSVAEGILRIVENSHVIYMSERIKLIDILYKMCKNPDKAKFIAGSKLPDLEKKVVFSTPGKIRDGIDASWKDTLVLTSPISNINQMTGRILRKHEGKKRGTVIDIVDIGCEDIRKTSFNRINFYKEKEWEIQYVLVNRDMQKFNIEEDEAMSIINGD